MVIGSTPPPLTSVTLTIRIPHEATTRDWEIEMQGRSHLKRASIWHEKVSYTRGEVDHGLQVCDQVNWWLHAVLQDRPTSPFWLDRALKGLPVGVQGILWED